MLWRRRGGRCRALLHLRRGVSDVGAASGRVEPNRNSALRSRGAGPHHIVVFVMYRQRAKKWPLVGATGLRVKGSILGQSLTVTPRVRRTAIRSATVHSGRKPRGGTPLPRSRPP